MTVVALLCCFTFVAIKAGQQPIYIPRKVNGLVGRLVTGVRFEPMTALSSTGETEKRSHIRLRITIKSNCKGMSTHLFSQVVSWLLQICICHYFIKIQPILLDKSMAARLTSLHRSSNSLTNRRPGLHWLSL